MTVAGAIAARAGEGVPETIVSVYADSRATSLRGDVTDGEQKLFDIGGCCVTISGRTYPFAVVRDAPIACASLWVVAGTLFRAIADACAFLRVDFEDDSLEVLIAGFLSDGSPAIAAASFEAADTNTLQLYRPEPGEVVSRVVGMPEAQELMAEAARMSIAKTRWDPLHSVLHTLMLKKVPGVGGGISYAVRKQGEPAFGYPVCRIAGVHYCRGHRLRVLPDGASLVSLRLDRGLFPKLRRRNRKQRSFTGGRPTLAWTATETLCIGVPGLFLDAEPDWSAWPGTVPANHFWIDAPSEPKGMGQGFVSAPDVSSAMHGREVEAIEHHRRGKPVPGPKPMSATTPPSSPSEIEFAFKDMQLVGQQPRPTRWDWKS